LHLTLTRGQLGADKNFTVLLPLGVNPIAVNKYIIPILESRLKETTTNLSMLYV
jgi:hypothetical protein